MVATFAANLGQKLAKLFGQPDLGRRPADPATRETLADLFDHDALADVLSFESFDAEHGIFVNRGSAGFVVESVPLVGLDATAQRELASFYEEILKEGDSIQCLLLADHRVGLSFDYWSQAREARGGVHASLAARRSQFLRESNGSAVRHFRFILSYSRPFKKEPSLAQLKDLAAIKEQLLTTLKSLTYSFAWTPSDFLTCVGGMVGFDPSSDVPRRRWNPLESLSHQLTNAGQLRVEDTGLKWSPDTEFRSYRVGDEPAEWSLAGMQGLIGDFYREAYRIDVPFYLHYGVHMPNQSKAQKSFKTKSLLIENQGKSGALLRLIPDLAKELSDTDTVRRALNQGSRLVWTQLSAGIWSAADAIEQQETALKSLFRIHQFSLHRNDHIHLPAFLASLPMTWGEYAQDLRLLNLLKTTISAECSHFVPIQGEWQGTPSPGMMLVGRRGQLLNWNPFDNKSGNYNCVVVGRSGAGKSVFMQDLVSSGLGTGGRVYILEVGRSFEKLCSFFSGQQIEFSGDSQICLNPFSRIPVEDREAQLAAFSMLKSIVSCMAAPLMGTSDYENALIEKAIHQAWDLRGNQATISDLAHWLSEHPDERARTLGTMLGPYSKGGTYARYFEGENNVDFSSPMVVIELEELKEQKDLQSVVLQLFIMTITNQAFLGDRKTPFYICIDEAWDILRSKQTGVFIETLARRLRKYRGSLVVGTQNVEEFFASPSAQAAFENSDWMCLLAQANSSIARFAKAEKINLSAGMQRALESVHTVHGEFSEVMIADADGGYSIGRLMIDPFTQLLYTTQPEEFAHLKDLQAQGMTIVEAVDHMLANQTKSGGRGR